MYRYIHNKIKITIKTPILKQSSIFVRNRRLLVSLQHPGGEEIILENAGTDATIPFESKGHSLEGYKLMEKYCIGELIEVDYITSVL